MLLHRQSRRFDDLLARGGQPGQRQNQFRVARRRVQRLFLEPEVELSTAAVAWERWGWRLAFRTVCRTGDLNMKMLGVTIPGTYLVKPGVISSGLTAQRLLDRRIDQDADDYRILRSRSNELSMSVGPQFRINIPQIGRDHIGARAKLALLAALGMVWHRRKPNIDVEADLMAGVLGKHLPAARLRHVANQKTVPANLFCVRGKPFDEANELWITPVAVTRRPHDLPGRTSGRQRHGAGEAAIEIATDRARRSGKRRRFAREQFLGRR